MKKIILIIISIAVLSGGYYFYSQFSGPVPNAKEERYVVKLGTKEEEIVADLIAEGFLKNKKIFNLILDFKGWHKNLQPGSYLISKGMNAYQLAKVLALKPYQRWVVILPGKRKEQVALTLKKALSWPDNKVQDFIKEAEEGYLYPDTYLFDVDFEAKEVVQKFKNNFNEKFTAKLQNDLLAQDIRNDTALKIASLIERESGGEEDKPIIAAIIWNRLEKGMRLEIDATVQYAITSEKLAQIIDYDQIKDDFSFWSSLPPNTVKKIISPYNTYLNEGLPPGPICSPSISSIEAVTYSAQTKALYYLHSPDKKIHTANIYQEHLKNIEKYLK
ncbi:MAG: endolytic transglycosylase MltG [Patescibacteria group bacterium]|nr:endolytic transglycosylase MltG [Patescibacteria group bacterium]